MPNRTTRSTGGVVATGAAEASAVEAPEGCDSFPGIALRPARALTVPDAGESPVRHFWEADWAGLTTLYERLAAGSDGARHRMFGWPDLAQPMDTMRLRCQLASNGVGSFADPARYPSLEAGEGDWVLLWQLPSSDDSGLGGFGMVYYWIRRQDLAAGAFDRVWLILQLD